MASDRTATYLDEVLSHVRWKRAHASIRRELADHIEDARLGFVESGTGQDEAAALAVREMGDPAEVGAKLNTSYRPAAHWSVWIPFALLLAAGLLVRRYIGGETPELIFLFLMPAALIGASVFPVNRLARWAWPCYGLLCLVMLLIACVGKVTGAGLFVAVSGRAVFLEYPTLFLPLTYALLLYRMRGRGPKGILLLYACLIPPVLILAYAPSTAALALTCAVCALITLYAALSGWFGGSIRAAVLMAVVPPLLVLLLLLFMLLLAPYRMARLETVFRPETDPQGAGYVGTAVKQLMERTNFIGPLDPLRLTDNALTAYQYSQKMLSHDFILTLLAVRLGRAAFAAVALLLCIFVAGAFRACLKQRSMLGRLVALCVILTFAVQCAGYILGNLGVVLFTAYPLPLLGIGDASLLCNLLLCGALLSILRNGVLLDDGKPGARGDGKAAAGQSAPSAH